MAEQFFDITQDDKGINIMLLNHWVLKNVADFETALKNRIRKVKSVNQAATLNFIGMQSLKIDTSGAFLIKKVIHHFEQKSKNLNVEFVEMPEEFFALFAKFDDLDLEYRENKPTILRGPIEILEGIGKAMERMFWGFAEMPNLIGLFIIGLVDSLIRPHKIRFTAMVYHIQSMTLPAIPIVAAVNFMVGAVLTELAADRLPGFGAETLIVGFMGMVTVSEISILLAGMMVAGRSSSAVTAEVGSMKINEEIDSMKIMGLDLLRYLVMPRVFGMIISLPMLTFFSIIFGLLGSATLLNLRYGMPFNIYIDYAYAGVGLDSLASAMVKTPFIAIMLMMVACNEGLKVKSNAASLGYHTTVSVVKGLFLVIIIDAIVAIYFMNAFPEGFIF